MKPHDGGFDDGQTRRAMWLLLIWAELTIDLALACPILALALFPIYTSVGAGYLLAKG